ncbi:pentapeptide repeat-containing protein, partial [Mycobacterium bourgelatii]
AGHYNTGSFNAGSTNTGDFNPGNINTGWFNTGHSNTGIANAGNVNTGAFLAGDYSNGTLWRGSYEGLPGLSLVYTIPQFPAVAGDVSGAIDAFTLLPPIDIPSVPLFVTLTGHAGPVNIPSIPIPSIHVSANPTVDIGPITIAPITISTPGLEIRYSSAGVLSISGGSGPGVLAASYLPAIHFQVIAETPGGISSSSSNFAIHPIVFNPTTATALGFTIGGPIHVGLPVSVTIPGFDIAASGVPKFALGMAVNLETPSSTWPITVAFDRLPLEIHVNSTAGPVNIPIFGFGGTPGFWNTTPLPSSGIFNVGGGGGSGFWNSGSGMSGWFNAISDPVLGSASGFYNFGTQLSGLLNRGAGLSGALNTGALDLVISSVVSGFNNFGQRLSGWLYQGTGP